MTCPYHARAQRHTDPHKHTLVESWCAGVQVDRWLVNTNTDTDRQTDRQTDTYTHAHTHTLTHSCARAHTVRVVVCRCASDLSIPRGEVERWRLARRREGAR